MGIGRERRLGVAVAKRGVRGSDQDEGLGWV